jgi:hypothetical protein
LGSKPLFIGRRLAVEELPQVREVLNVISIRGVVAGVVADS